MIASHYAEPVANRLAEAAPLLGARDGEPVAALSAGDELWTLDDTLGWAWGYAGPDRLVGYVRADALAR